MELSGLASTLRFRPAEIPEVLSPALSLRSRIQGLDSVGGTGMDRWPRGCRWIRTNRERVSFPPLCLRRSLLSAPLSPRPARKVIGRLFATLSGTKCATLPVDCRYLSSDKETENYAPFSGVT